MTRSASTKQQLRPCPLCGGVVKLRLMPGTVDWWRVQCDWYECGCTTWAMRTPEKALAAWHRKPDDEQA